MNSLTLLTLAASATPQYPYAPAVDFGPDIERIRSLECHDLDADGDLDIVVGFRDLGGLRWYENLGAGAFDQGRDLPSVTPGIFGLDVADLDGDGDLDILHASDVNDAVGWTPNLGGARFDVPRPLLLGVNESHRVRAVDVDQDGDLDVVIASSLQADILWLESLGPGSFASVAVLATAASNVYDFDFDDLDTDGDLDLVAGNAAFGSVTAFERSASGFVPVLVNAPGFLQMNQMRVEDLDSDGVADLLLSGRRSGAAPTLGSAVWLRGLGGLAFDPPVTLGTALTDMIAIHAADVDGDTDVDVVSGARGGAELFYENLGGGMFAPQVEIGVEGLGGAAIDIVDIDGNGTRDVIVGCRQDNGIMIVRGDGTGGFDDGVKINLWGDLTYKAHVWDFDLDGDDDVFSVGAQSYSIDDAASILLYESVGGGAFLPPRYLLTIEAAFGFQALRMDVDVDGLDDFVYVEGNSPVTFAWLRHLPGGAFAPSAALTLPGLTISGLATVGDLDGDGDEDVLMGRSGDGLLRWWPNLGAAFGTQRTLSGAVSSSSLGVLIADLDVDGVNDVIQTYGRGSLATSGISWYRGLGQGQFSARIPIFASGAAQGIAAVDFDGDGDLDLASSGSGPRNSAFVWYEQVTLSNWSLHSLLTPFSGSGVALADMDTDGDLDVLFAAYSTSLTSTYWLENLGGGILNLPALVGDWVVRQAHPFDRDGDGDLDLLIAGQRMKVLENLTVTGPIGVTLCDPAVPNSTGNPGRLRAEGSENHLVNELRLRATDLPTQALLLCLASQYTGFVATPGGSAGNLCLAGPIGRGAGGITTTGSGGAVTLTVDVAGLPQPAGAMAAIAGSTWAFQCWHRDVVSGATTSNFTNAVAVRFE